MNYKDKYDNHSFYYNDNNKFYIFKFNDLFHKIYYHQF